MKTSEKRNIKALPVRLGRNCSSVWMSVMSEMDRLTTCPVRRSSCWAPPSRSSAANASLRRSYCTPRESRPER